MRIYTLIICLFTTFLSNAQPSFAVTAGFSLDANRKPGNSKTFTNIPFSLQWIPGNSSKRFVPFIKLDYLLPITKTFIDHAYTTDPSLPATIEVEKSIKPTLVYLSGGLRFRIYTVHRHTFFADALLTVVGYQNIQVSYSKYDTDKYEVINPDVSLRKTGAAIGVGIAYKLLLTGNSSVVCMFHINSPPFVSSKADKYELSYRLVAPLQLTVGYSFIYKKSKK